MTAVDKYVNTENEAGKLAKAAASYGAETITLVATEEILDTDSDTSVYRFFKNVPSNLIPVEITVACDTITGGTDYDLGLYKTNYGAVVEVDVLMEQQTLATALTLATGHQVGLSDLDIANVGKTLAEISGQTDPDPAYDIALTANTVGTATGTVTIIAKFAQG